MPILWLPHNNQSDLNNFWDFTNSVYIHFIFSFKYHVFNEWEWSVWLKHVAGVEGINKFLIIGDVHLSIWNITTDGPESVRLERRSPRWRHSQRHEKPTNVKNIRCRRNSLCVTLLLTALVASMSSNFRCQWMTHSGQSDVKNVLFVRAMNRFTAIYLCIGRGQKTYLNSVTKMVVV